MRAYHDLSSSEPERPGPRPGQVGNLHTDAPAVIDEARAGPSPEEVASVCHSIIVVGNRARHGPAVGCETGRCDRLGDPHRDAAERRRSAGR